MKKVTIVTRAYNRLEYTIKCVNSVRDNTIYKNYEHLIVNNGSFDGTRAWLTWINLHCPEWFDRVVSLHLDSNRGDWGGLLAGLFYSADADYIVQLDNDIQVPVGWLTTMMHVLTSAKEDKIVQASRVGYRRSSRLEGNGDPCMIDGYNTVKIRRPVSCFIIKRSHFLEALPSIDQNSGKYGKTELGKLLGVRKILDLEVDLIDGKQVSPKGTFINHEKYPRSSKAVYVKN